MIYAGGESSRPYHGRYLVRATFLWPWGQPGEHDTEPAPYEDCAEWLAMAPFVPLTVVDPDTGKAYRVGIRSARIEPA